MDTSKLEYNSQRSNLFIPEYGRHVQKLIDVTVDIKDVDKRRAYTEKIVNLMEQINPSNEKGEEVKIKFWKHAILISNFRLNVTLPNGEVFDKEDLSSEIPKVEYPQQNPRLKHYGNNIQAMIDKALSIDDQDKRDEYTKVIGAYMKMAYKNWHQDHYVSDDMIIDDLKKISDGKLTLSSDDNLSYLSKQIKTHTKKKNKRKKQNRRRRR